MEVSRPQHIVVLHLVGDSRYSVVIRLLWCQHKDVLELGVRAVEILLGNKPVSIDAAIFERCDSEGALDELEVLEVQIISVNDTLLCLLFKWLLLYDISMEALIAN